MRAPIFFLLILSASALAFPDNASSPAPPPVPQSDGLLALQAVLVNGTPAAGMPLLISATKAGSSAPTAYRLITGRDGNVLLTLGRGSYQLDCVLDNMATSGADYAATASISVPGEQNLTLAFYPAGSVAAAALEGGQVVPFATMHASCASDWFDYEMINGADAQAGQAGDFIFRALPAGTCVISASTQASAGSVQVNVGQGTLSSVQVELRPKALAPTDIALALAAIAVLAVLVYYLLFAKRKQPEAAAQDAAPEKKAPMKKSGKAHAKEKPGAMKEARKTALREAAPRGASARMPAQQKASAFDADGEKARAVLSTLSEREADIVRLLCASGGKAKRSTMQHKLLIPKTSLLRNLRSLERKNIVKLIPFGRNLVAELERSLFE
ncbi:MAG: hypothetical protein WC263_04470 [Candidatus Micrarchaeia archaeon]|jgi:uncharacterized membrane protein